MKRLLRSLILLSMLLVVAACATPTVAPVALVASLAPSATPLPPTATLAPTDTPVPTLTSTPTSTPKPTDTPTLVPTATSTLTPTATATKIAATAKPRPTKTTAASGAATSAATATATAPVAAPHPAAIPAGAPLNVAVVKLFNTGRGLLGELNQVMAGAGGSCSVVIPFYDAFASAPAYEAGQLSSVAQTAYDLYRQAIDTVNGTAPKIRRICNMGGGRIGKLDTQEAQLAAGVSVSLLGRAIDLLPTVDSAADTSAPSAQPTATKAAASSMALSDLLIKTRDEIRSVGGLLDVAQTKLDAGFCQQFGPQYATIINQVTLNTDGRDPVWNEQYNAYKVIVGFFQNKLYRAREVCDAGGGQIGKGEFGEMRQGTEVAAIAAARAYDQLKFKNLLGQ